MKFHARLDGQPVDENVNVAFTIRAGRDGTSGQPDASAVSVTFTAIDDRMQWLKPGQTLTLLTEPWEGSAWSELVLVWTCRVGDISRSLRYLNQGAAMHTARVQATGPRAKAARTMIGDVPWNVELDGTRIKRIVEQLGKFPFSTTVQLASDPDLAFGVTRATSRWTAIASEAAVTVDDSTPGRVAYSMPKHALTWDEEPPALTWDKIGETWNQQGSYGWLRSREPFAPLGTDYTITLVLDSAHGGFLTIFTAETDYRVRVPAGRSTVTTPSIPVRGKTITLNVRVEHSCTLEWAGVTGSGCDAGTVELLRRDIDRQAVTTAGGLAADSGGGVLWETRDGAFVYADADQRALAAGPVVRIPAAAVEIGGARLRQADADRINRMTITYGPTPEGGEQPELTVAAQWSISADGEFSARLTTDIEHKDDASQRASRILRNHVTISPTLESLPVLLDELATAAATALLTAAPGAHVELVDLPPDDWGATTWAGYIEGWTLTSGNRDVLELTVTDRVATIDLMTWDDMTAGTWDEMTAVTWDDMTGLKPIFHSRETVE